MNYELELSAERMREIGYRVVDMLVEHLATLPSQRVGTKGDPAKLLAAFREPAPEQGSDFEAVLGRVTRDVLANTMHVNHPRFLSYVPGPGNFVGAMADAIVSAYNVFAGTWISGSGPAAVELAVIDWLRDLCGFPEHAGGLMVSGGTMANLTGLAVARYIKLGENVAGGTLYFSDQTHSSLEKALRVMGVPKECARKLRSDSDFRIPLEELLRALKEDRAEGKRPFCVVANAGTTNTGAVDSLTEIARVCRGEDLWLHVDGAYGAASVLCERGRALLQGMELADSLSLDPHKWLFQPFEAGCILLRDPSHLTQTFRLLPEYLSDTQQYSAEFNFTDHGIQLTRGFRALKLWMSIQVFGLGAFRSAIERGFALAELTEAGLRDLPGWEVVTPAQMGVVCFRHSATDAAGHLRLVQTMLEDGYMLITSTNLGGQTVLRACTINPRTTEADIGNSLRRLDEFARGE